MLEELLRNIVGIVCKLVRLVKTEMQCTEVRQRESAWRIRRGAWPPNLDELRRLCEKALEQDNDLRSDLTDAESWATEVTPSEGGPLTQDEAFAAWAAGDFCLDKLKGTLARYQAKAKTSEQTGAGSGQCGAGQGEGKNKGAEKPWTPSEDRPLTPEEAFKASENGDRCLAGLENTLTHYQAQAKTGEGAEPSGGREGGLCAASKNRRRRKRGRPGDTNTVADERIWNAWRTGRYKAYRELALEFGISERETELAIDRHRKRLERRDG
jgi:hypothetical protein